MRKGISLVALVVTVVVLIILTSAVVLTLIDTSILDKADEAKQKQNEQEVYSLIQREVLNLQSEDYTLKVGQGFETALYDKLNKKYPDAKAEVYYSEEYKDISIKYTLNNKTYSFILNENYKLTLYENEFENIETIPTTQSYVGYYADVDGDKQPDGIIYADLAEKKTGQWSNDYSKFSYLAITGMKEYYVSKTNYEGVFGTKDVLTSIGRGKDRFYVMALEDINPGNLYYWYYNASGKISNYETVTSTSFGTGRENTNEMIKLWNNSTYGQQKDTDIWGLIQDKVKDGWFVPSREEWSAFGYNLGITNRNFSNYGLPNYCWSSSVGDEKRAWCASLNSGYIVNYGMNLVLYIRLSTTF